LDKFESEAGRGKDGDDSQTPIVDAEALAEETDVYKKNCF
jgi:hypothetical protein